ncbi:MAG: hypothetical protein ACRCV9_01030, partial [Burkholderiaceae bacterium]
MSLQSSSIYPPNSAAERSTVSMPLQRAQVSFLPSSINTELRTVDVVFSAGATVRRFDYATRRPYDETLEISESAIDLSRLQNGAAVLDTHASYELRNQIGVVERAWIEVRDGVRVAMATLRLSSRADVQDIWRDIQDGIFRNISVGYSITRMVITPAESRGDGGQVDQRTATLWQPQEISFVPVGADADAGVRSADAQAALYPCEVVRSAPATQTPLSTTELRMPDTNQSGVQASNPADIAAAERTRCAEILTLSQRHGFADSASGWIEQNMSVDAVRAAILDAQANRSEPPAGTALNVNPSARIEVIGGGDREHMRNAVSAVLEARMNPGAAVPEVGRKLASRSLLEVGREYFKTFGVGDADGMSRDQITEGIMHFRSGSGPGFHTTGDFSALLSNAAGKRLRAQFEQAPGTYRQWARRAEDLPDFKSVTLIDTSAISNLAPLNEAGELTYGTMRDGAETYKAATYGKNIALSRQAIMNDDLRSFSRIISLYAAAAARLENKLVYAQLTGNPLLAADGALFQAAAVRGNNLMTGAPSALSFTSLNTARTNMMLQKGMARGDGEDPEVLNISPRYLLTSVQLQPTAWQLTSANYMPNQQNATSEFKTGGRAALEVISDAEITSATQWYLAADANQMDT